MEKIHWTKHTIFVLGWIASGIAERLMPPDLIPTPVLTGAFGFALACTIWAYWGNIKELTNRKNKKIDKSLETDKSIEDNWKTVQCWDEPDGLDPVTKNLNNRVLGRHPKLMKRGREIREMRHPCKNHWSNQKQTGPEIQLNPTTAYRDQADGTRVVKATNVAVVHPTRIEAVSDMDFEASAKVEVKKPEDIDG